MEIIKIESRIITWEQLTDGKDFKFPFKAGERQEFLLYPPHPEHKSLFKLSGIYHVTCVDTDFILDAKVDSLAQLDFNGQLPKANDLYEVYKQARIQWIGNILQESMKNGYQLVLLDSPPTPYENIKQFLDEAIYRSLEED